MKTNSRIKSTDLYNKAGATLLTSLEPKNIFLGGVGLLAMGFGTHYLLKQFTPSQIQLNDANINHAIGLEKKKGNSLSYPLVQYDIYAGNIEEATNTSGTDEQGIYTVMSAMKNNADLLQLQKAYGKRLNWWFGVPTGNYTLSEVLQSELDDAEKETIRNILTQNGITIQIV